MYCSFDTKLEVAFFYLPTVTKPCLLKTTIPAWLSGAFFISLYIKAESTSGALSSGMNILSSKFEFEQRKKLTSLSFFKEKGYLLCCFWLRKY
jgi:hypothetical protein